MKTMCPPGYHQNGFVVTHALGHIMYGYDWLVPMNQRVLNKLSKEHNINGHKWSTTHRVLKSYRCTMNIYAVMKIMCPLGYHPQSFVATHIWLHIYYAHLASVRFEHSVWRGSPMLWSFISETCLAVTRLVIVSGSTVFPWRGARSSYIKIRLPERTLGNSQRTSAKEKRLAVVKFKYKGWAAGYALAPETLVKCNTGIENSLKKSLPISSCVGRWVSCVLKSCKNYFTLLNYFLLIKALTLFSIICHHQIWERINTTL